MASPRYLRRLTAMLPAAGLCLLAACAAATFEARPEDIPVLEARVAAAPGDVDAVTELGMAYYQAGRHQDAVRVLDPLTSRADASGSAHLYLGLAQEELQAWAEARTAYERYLEMGENASLMDDVRGRLALVTRQQMRTEARAALAREAQLSQEPPTPNSVAVFPFQLLGLPEEYAPLQTAMADMIITDLGLSNAVTSVERVRVRSMLDEMVLTQAGLADEATGARAGRLLKAENVVQGTLSGGAEGQVQLDAAVLATAGGNQLGEVSDQRPLDAIFEMEKAVVFAILQRLGVQLTAAETEAINENRASNLLAFLAYGRGLEAMDRGDYATASSAFGEATQLDPSFTRAQVQQTEAAEVGAAAQASATTDVATAGLAPQPAGGVSTTGDMARNAANAVNPSGAVPLVAAQTGQTGGGSQPATQQAETRNPQSESGGQGGAVVPPTPPPPPVTVITIVIPRPGGGQ